MGNIKKELAVQVGLKIKELREAKGWNYKQLAAKSGVSSRMIALIESGENCSIIILADIAKALGRSPASFLMRKKETGG